MHYQASLSALALLPLALAQYGGGSSDSTSSKTPTQAATGGTIHKVTVGADNKLVFNPDSFTAAVGDSVEFHYYPPTHSVVQASFEQPCAPVNASAFFSGGFKTDTGVNANVFTIKINSTDPIWYYCGFPGHCQSGMVGVINPPSDKTIAQYIANAANATVGARPPAQAQGGIVGAAATTASTTGSATQSAASPTRTGNAGIESHGGVQWTIFALTGLAAAGLGSLMY